MSGRKKLGLVLLGVVVLYWIVVPVIPFLDLPYKAAIIPAMVVLGEGLTLIAIALLGKEYWGRIKSGTAALVGWHGKGSEAARDRADAR